MVANYLLTVMILQGGGVKEWDVEQEGLQGVPLPVRAVG